MSYITKIFERLDLQQIRSFLLNGVVCLKVSDKTYEERIELAGNPVFEMIDEKFPERKENDKIANDIHNYVSTTQNVYMEIGMQCGAVLAKQLLENPIPK